MSPRSQSAGRRLSLITIDQILSGASNLFIALAAAHTLGVEGFGLFTLVFLIYVFAQGLTRALVSQPLLVHPEDADTRPGESLGATCVLGLAIGGTVLGLGLLVSTAGARLGLPLIVLGLALPLLMAQDLGRHLGFATQRPSRALTLDVVWLVLVVAAGVLLISLDRINLAGFVTVWAGAGAVSGLLVFWQARGHPVVMHLGWVRERWSFSWRYLVSSTAGQGSALFGSAALGWIAGPYALGAVRGALMLIRPFMTFQAAAQSAAIAEVAREPQESGARAHVRRTTVLSLVVAGANTLLLVFLPDPVGRAFLGQTWDAVAPLALAASAQTLCLGISTGIKAGLLGLKEIRTAMVIDVATTGVVLAAFLGGAVIGGGEGALWAVAIGHGLAGVAWWVAYRSRMAKGVAAGRVDPGVTQDALGVDAHPSAVVQEQEGSS